MQRRSHWTTGLQRKSASQRSALPQPPSAMPCIQKRNFRERAVMALAVCAPAVRLRRGRIASMRHRYSRMARLSRFRWGRLAAANLTGNLSAEPLHPHRRRPQRVGFQLAPFHPSTLFLRDQPGLGQDDQVFRQTAAPRRFPTDISPHRICNDRLSTARHRSSYCR